MFECMPVLKKSFFIIFLFNVSSFFYGLDAEIDKPKTYLNANAIHNWQSGKIDVHVQLSLKKAGLKMPADRQEAFFLISRYAPYALKNIYLALPLDSSKFLGNYLAEGRISFDDISDIISNSTISNASLSSDLKMSEIYASVSLLEISKLLIKHKNPYTARSTPLTSSSQKYSGIIIDARGSLPVHGEYLHDELQPALFPKIWDSNMNLVFEKNMLYPEVGRKRLIVSYTDNLDERQYRNFIGNKPLRIVARGIFGVNRTDPIISRVDATKILSEQNVNLIKEGRVLIICDNLIKAAPYPQADENFYFAYRDIETKIGDGDQSITVSEEPNDSIITITMYNIHFVADKATILPSDYGRIDVIAEALRRLGPNVRFIIEGHTAELYRPRDQKQLSEERALEMAKELSKRGIEMERITTAGFGATVPIAPSDTEANKAKNRRVEIKILRR